MWETAEDNELGVGFNRSLKDNISTKFCGFTRRHTYSNFVVSLIILSSLSSTAPLKRCEKFSIDWVGLCGLTSQTMCHGKDTTTKIKGDIEQ